MRDKLIVAWRKQSNQQWFIIGFLQREPKENNQWEYLFYYAKGVQEAFNNGFSPLFGESDIKELKKAYFSDSLFPVFSNRLMTKSRPEYPQYKEWLELEDESNPLIELAKNNGVRATDSLQLFGIPQKRNQYIVDFFIHKSNLTPQETQQRMTQRSLGEQLYLSQDIQNPYDKDALLIRTENPLEILGYAPRIYSQDFRTLLNNPKAQATLKIQKLNPQAPLFYRLLCRFEANWIEGFKPFNDIAFDPLNP